MHMDWKPDDEACPTVGALQDECLHSMTRMSADHMIEGCRVTVENPVRRLYLCILGRELFGQLPTIFGQLHRAAFPNAFLFFVAALQTTKSTKASY